MGLFPWDVDKHFCISQEMLVWQLFSQTLTPFIYLPELEKEMSASQKLFVVRILQMPKIRQTKN